MRTRRTKAVVNIPQRASSVQAASSAHFKLFASAEQRFRYVTESQSFAWIVLATTLLLTLWLWRFSGSELNKRQQDQFLQAAEHQKALLIQRMQDYEQVLRGGAGLFAARGLPTREEWRTYVASLELDKSLPGILGTGISIMVPKTERAKHEQSIRAEGYPDFAIKPPGDREMLSSIIYLEPLLLRNNQRAFGFDMYSEPVRGTAMARARDTGRPAMSGKVTLMQEDNIAIQPGFLIYVPIYRQGMPRDTVDARRKALQGFVYSPFRSFDLLTTIYRDSDQDVEFMLFDREPVAENLLFASEGAGRYARHQTDMALEIAGHPWTARFKSSRQFEGSTASSQPKLILFGGIVLDLMLFTVLYINARFRRKIREAALKLEHSLESFQTLVENIPGAVFRIEIGHTPNMVQLSSGIQPLTGELPARFLSGEMIYGDMIHADDQDHVRDVITQAISSLSAYGVEYRILTSHGITRWVSERGRSTADQSGQTRWLEGVILDITERKKAEMMIHELAFIDTLTDLPNRRLLLDRLDHQLAASERTGHFGALLFIDMDDFKAINDTLGHQAGDQVLVEVAARLIATVRESDTVARLGGDEFVIILDNLGPEEVEALADADELGEKIRAYLSQPYCLGAECRTSTPSIGITIFRGHAHSADQLLRHADQAMYRAKSSGRNRVQFYCA